MPVEIKLETPVKQPPKYPIEDKILYENWEIHEIPKECIHVII